jgi:hypothetical protein
VTGDAVSKSREPPSVGADERNERGKSDDGDGCEYNWPVSQLQRRSAPRIFGRLANRDAQAGQARWLALHQSNGTRLRAYDARTFV